MWISGPASDFPELNPTTYNVLVARDGYCTSAATTCRALVTALERSLRLINTDPQKSLALVSRRFERMDPELMKAAFESFQRNTPQSPQPMARAFDQTVENMFGPQEDKPALRALARTIFTDDFVRK
jgi:hypothetical protein